FSGRHGRNDSVTEEYGQEAIDSAAQRLRSTRRLRRIPNARHFWFASSLVFTAQYFKCSGMRCSPLNAALNI
ncbi:hypothetical protein, partial [Vibrio cincinnatiensis]